MRYSHYQHLSKQLLFVNHKSFSFVLDYSEMIITHPTTATAAATSSSLDCLSMIVESIDPTKLLNSSSSAI